jgi:hypothetical protein
MIAFPKTMRAAASGIARHLIGQQVEAPGATLNAIAMKDYVAVTSTTRDVCEADWMAALQTLPYRTSFQLKRNSDGRLTAIVRRLDEAS